MKGYVGVLCTIGGRVLTNDSKRMFVNALRVFIIVVILLMFVFSGCRKRMLYSCGREKKSEF